MTKRAILSEKLEDNKAAAEWGIRQAELIKKSEDITRRLAEKYIPIILSRNGRNNYWQEYIYSLKKHIFSELFDSVGYRHYQREIHGRRPCSFSYTQEAWGLR